MISLELEQFIDTRSLASLGSLMNTISQQCLPAKTIGVSCRTICHWDEKGIIRFSRENAGSNRKYSFVDYIWIKVVEELRAFGVEIPIIQKIANEIYEPLPIKEIFDVMAENKLEGSSLQNIEDDEDKEKFIEFLKSGEYKTADLSSIENQFNYLHVLVSEVISTKKPVSIIVFKDGDWFPYIKENEHLYSEDLMYKKEYESQVSVSLTNLVFNFILEKNINDFVSELDLFSKQEMSLVNIVVKEEYKKITVLYKSKKKSPLDILKSDTVLTDLIKVFRKKEYREFIVTDLEGKEYRIRDEKQNLDLSKGVKELLIGDDNSDLD
jgi:DNA-binding transcriptional MerR regulator